MAINLGNISNSNSNSSGGLKLNKKVATTIAPIKKKKKKDLLTTIASTAADFGTNIGKGFLYGVEGSVDLGRYGVAGVADLLGNEKYASDVRERAQQNTTADLTRAADQTYNKNSALKEGGLLEFGANGIGYIASIAGAGGLLGGASTINLGGKAGQAISNLASKAGTGIGSKALTTAGKVISDIGISTPSALSAAGSGMSQAYNSGATDTQAVKFGLSKGLVEGLVEGFGGQTALAGTVYGKGITDTAKKALVNKVKSNVGKTLLTLGFEAGTEGMEDVISDFVDPYLQRASYNPDAENATAKQLAQAFIQSAALSAIVSTPGSISQVRTMAKQEMQNAIDSAVQGGILNLPGAIGDVKQSIQTEKAKTVQNKVNLPISSPIEQQTNKVDTNIPTIQNKPLELDNKLIEKENISNVGTNENNNISINKKEIPKTVSIYVKSKFSDNAAYTDVPVIGKEDNITLYQGSNVGEQRQFWTPNKDYAKRFGEVKEKTGSFYKIDNGNRVTDVYVEIPTKQEAKTIETQPIENIPFNKQTGEVIDPIKPIKEIPKIAKLVDAKPVEIDKSVGNKVKDALQLTVNKGYYIDDYSEKSGNKEIKFKYDKMLSSDAEGQYEIAIGQTNNEGKIIGKSISDIWKPINDSGKKAEFSDYLLHKHNIDRMAQGKPVFGEDVTADMSKQKVNEYEANNPEFVDWSKDINTFNKNQLQNMVDAGLTSTETQELLNSMYDNYIRIQRDVKTGTAPITSNRGNVKIKNPLQKAKGGSQDILPLDESMAAQALQVKNVIRRNDLGLEMLKTSGGTITDSTNVLNKTEDGKYTFTVFKEGQPISIEVSEGIYNGLSNDLKNQIKGVEDKLSFATKPIQKLAQLQRSVLTTSNPFFIATNFFKDFQDGAFNSKYSRKFVKNYVKAISEIAKNGDLWNLYQANGGNQNTYFDYKTGFKKDKNNVITKSIKKIQNINEIIEQAPRLAEFISTIEDGKSVTEAMYNAAEITTNFKRGGDITKALNRNGANFLNASIQGFDKQVRNFKGQNGAKGYVSLLAKAIVWGILPSLLNHLIYEDDDDYKKLTSDTKDRYFLFKTSDNNFIKIPKGRVLSIFGSAARTLETPNGSEKNTKEFLNLIMNQVAPNNPLEDNVLAPITQAIKNETWYGGEIVPQRLQDELAKNQYDETTDAFSKWLGSKINVSPKKINYVLDQYSGGIGDIILPLSTKQAEQNPISAKFTVNSIMSNKNVGEFFDTKEKLTKIANDSKANEEDILKSKYMNSVQAKANDLYKEKRDVQNSDLVDSEKTKEVKRIQNEINTIFKDALSNYEEVDMNSNYATIGDREFYKKDNEWKKVSQDMSEKNNELEKLDFDKNEYYKNYAKISDIYNKKIGTSQKKSDIIDVIKNSGLNNNQKAYMYTKYYSSKENTDIINKLNINFDEYLKLEGQNIEATTNSIGTKVLRKRKDNYISAVNKLNLTIPQKALLIKSEYSSYDKYNNEIIKYVNNSNMNLNEKKSYLIGLGFKIKNGKVSWK